jgi:DNA adenine methylase
VLCAKERSKVEVVNDLKGDLIALYRNLQFHLPALLSEIDWFLASRQNFHDFIAQPGLTELQRAARFLLVNRTSFGADMHSFGVQKTKGGGINFDKTSVANLMGPLHERLNGVIIENASYERCLKNYDSKDSLFFLDPPYQNAPTGPYAGFSEADLQLFRQRVGKLQGKWIVTLNDSEFTRDLFAGCNIIGTENTNGQANKRTAPQTKLKEIIVTPN